MKIAPKTAEAFLSSPGKEARAALLYGPDSGLVRERAGKIKQAILSGNSDPFCFTELEEAVLVADPARLADELSAINLMAPTRCILVRDASDKLTKIIESATTCFDSSVFLVIAAGELSPRSSLRAYCEKAPKIAALACYKDEVRDVQEVIRKYMAQAGISLTRDASEYLAQQLGNDRYVTYQELDKIAMYAGSEKKITLEELEQLVGYNRDSSTDALVNALADKNMQALEKTLTLLLRDGIQPIMYLRALSRYFNRLYGMRAMAASGIEIEHIVASAKPPVFFRQVPVMTRHLQQWSNDQLARALKLLTEAELACKTSDMPAVAASTRKLLQITQLR